MQGIIYGFLIGILIGTVFVGFGWLLYDDNTYDSKFRKAISMIMIIVGVVLAIVSPFIGLNIKKGDEIAYIEQYEIQKTSIESSISNDKLTGFERAELVKQANELNKELAKKKYDVNKWYGFAIDKEVLKLDYVKLK